MAFEIVFVRAGLANGKINLIKKISFGLDMPENVTVSPRGEKRPLGILVTSRQPYSSRAQRTPQSTFTPIDVRSGKRPMWGRWVEAVQRYPQ